MEKKTLLIILSSGGHTNQALKLIELLGDKYNYEYIINSDDKLSEKKIKKKGRIYKIINPRKMEDKCLLKVFLKYIPSTIQVLNILRKSKAKIIIGFGTASSVHVCILGKLLFRKKIIFFESWSRVYSKSLAGKFVYPFSDLFFIQWPQQKKNYPKAIYAGRLG